MRLLTTAALALLALVAACATPPILPQADSSCAGACIQIALLGCEDATPRGAPCVTWCAKYHAESYMPPWDACAAVATTREAMTACGIACEAGA